MTRRRGAASRALMAVAVAGFLVALGDTATQADTATPTDSGGCSGTASIAIQLPDGSIQTVSSAQVCAASDVFNTTYRTRSVPGKGNTQNEPVVARGTSIQALLESLTPGVDPNGVNFIDVPRADDTWATLTQPDLADPSDFADGLQPVFVVKGNHISYYRPLYDSAQDTNAADHVESPDGGTLDIAVHSGPLLTVTATTSVATPSRGAPVTFKATVAGGGAASKPYTYSWSFGDGSTGAGRSVDHPFTAAGTYEAQVSVAGADDSGGVSNQIAVTVGKPTKGGNGPGGGTSRNPHHPSTGPTGGQGHQGGGTTSPHGGSGHSATGTGPGIVGGFTPPPLSTSPPTSVIQGSTPVGTQPLLATSLPEVSGRVISPGMTLSAEQTAIAAAATAPAAQFDGGKLKVGGGIAALVGLVALLGFGMTRELRQLRRRSAGTS